MNKKKNSVLSRIRIQQHHCKQYASQKYQKYIPLDFNGQFLVLVHGISRNYTEMMRLALPFADLTGYGLIVPVFEETRCYDYQRLGRAGRGPRVDLALLAILDEVQNEHKCSERKVHLLGHSGGAQFCHRFAMFWSQRVASQILIAAGWYTLPVPEKYPYGYELRNQLPGASAHLVQYLSLPTLVLVGTEDCHQDLATNSSKRVVDRQGTNRLSRAECWVDKMCIEAKQRRLNSCIEMQLMPAVGHSFSEAVKKGKLFDRVRSFMELDK
ncbi:MAG: alpha/beta hydrolase [bacterium]